ncbi:hypothetical protein NYZ18_19060, partial [Acinetobacter baumannii]|nr:hypothetical protein [Acinetobacter baumannii]
PALSRRTGAVDQRGWHLPVKPADQSGACQSSAANGLAFVIAGHCGSGLHADLELPDGIRGAAAVSGERAHQATGPPAQAVA